MDSRVLAESSGIKTTLHFDEQGKMIVQNSADLSGEFKFNKAMLSEGMGQSANTRQVARIPLHVLHQLQTMWKTMGIDPKVGMKRFLNDPDMRAFRTSSAKV